MRAGGARLFIAASHAAAENRALYFEYGFARGRIFLQQRRLFGALGDRLIDYGPVSDGVENKLEAALRAAGDGAPTLCPAEEVMPVVRVIEALQALPIRTVKGDWICRAEAGRAYAPALDGILDAAYESGSLEFVDGAMRNMVMD